MTIKTRPLTLTINGKRFGPTPVPETLMMIDYLHEYARLTGSRLGCGQGVCRACVVIVDQPDGTSQELQSCVTPALTFDGWTIRTIEGHAIRDAAGEVVSLSPVQQAFLEHFSFQCGYCTPGFVNAATILLEQFKRSPVEQKDLAARISESLGTHVCRCTGYVRYFEAVKEVALRTPGLVVLEKAPQTEPVGRREQAPNKGDR
ncbi:(2Fe-2S)-binding protein [Pandoraea sp. PE-S2R-1]|uniref:(2Fe-2S)-binding protein n=1 Tax=Pandoraea sp. PE-S2R-1 TaxID=1986994 RepID=UPI000B3F7395|nr:(2Fe-2S)-binding protein [Pandoraea sp. PE-S2R-1]